MKFKNKIIIFTILTNFTRILAPFDLTICGPVQFADGIMRLPILFIDMLKNDLKINCMPSCFDTKDVPTDIKDIILNNDRSSGNICIYTDLLWTSYNNNTDYIPNCPIKMAYSMLESTSIPECWVSILNNKFDAVIVPDKFLINVYKNSGVIIPIFVLPIPVYLENFLSLPKKTIKSTPFVFGVNATFTERKNYLTLIKAFAQEFGSNQDFKLKIHAKDGVPEIEKSVRSLINKYNLSNVEIITGQLCYTSYIEWMKTIDCYVFISKGEGFSITPREAMAAGIPLILSNNSAHTTICNSGFVRSLVSDIAEPAYYEILKSVCGKNYNCSIERVQDALRDVYLNYYYHLKKAELGREWVKTYTCEQLKNLYCNFLKPKKIILNNIDQVSNDCLVTSSEKLYEKYLKYIVNKGS